MPQRLRGARVRKRDALIIRNSGLLDEAGYGRNNPDAADAATHYLKSRGKPNQLFDGDWYLRNKVEVKVSRLTY